MKFPLAEADVELPRLASRSCRKVSKSLPAGVPAVAPDALFVLVLFVLLDELPPEAA